MPNPVRPAKREWGRLDGAGSGQAPRLPRRPRASLHDLAREMRYPVAMHTPRPILIAGPTASGKSGLALALAVGPALRMGRGAMLGVRMGRG